jgi:peptidoglycan/xylan/chitin deacetylase (PgdA/CDA1 family)
VDENIGRRGPQRQGVPVLMYHQFYDTALGERQGTIDLPEKSVIVTIGDGAPSFFHEAVPVLKKYKVRGTGFIITKNLRASTVKKYSRGYIDLQPHSNNMHIRTKNGRGIFVYKSYGDAKADLEESTAKLGSNYAFAYPFGHYNAAAQKALRDAGFKMAFTTASGRIYPGMSQLSLPRVRISADISLGTYKRLVS